MMQWRSAADLIDEDAADFANPRLDRNMATHPRSQLYRSTLAAIALSVGEPLPQSVQDRRFVVLHDAINAGHLDADRIAGVSRYVLDYHRKNYCACKRRGILDHRQQTLDA